MKKPTRIEMARRVPNPRGTRVFDPFIKSYGLTAPGSPGSLRPGLDRVRLSGVNYSRKSRATAGKFMGHFHGTAIVRFDGERLPVRLAPWMLVEDVRLESSIEFLDFSDGYYQGIDTYEKRMLVSTTSQERIPDAFGRGVTSAYWQMRFERWSRTLIDAHNTEARKNALMSPTEHWVWPADRPLTELEASQ